jgi:hypothetical protein
MDTGGKAEWVETEHFYVLVLRSLGIMKLYLY